MLNWLHRLRAHSPAIPRGELREWKKHGDEHVARGELEQASDFYRRAIAADPSYIDARIGLAFCALETNRHDEAQTQLREALELASDVPDVHYLLGRLSKEQAPPDLDGAIEHWARALEVNRDFEPAYTDQYETLLEMGRIEDARRVLESAVAVYPDSAEFQVALGNVLMRLGNRTEAIGHYTAALAFQPESGRLQCALGDAHRTAGNLDAALGCYQAAIAMEPTLEQAHEGLGLVYEGKGRMQDATACFKCMAEVAPNSAVAHHRAATALLRAGKGAEALPHFREVARLDPQSGVAHMVGALSGQNPERPPVEYIETLFNDYAGRFDSHLVETLRYSIPEVLATVLEPYRTAAATKWDVLDLGCGTGLAAAAIASHTRSIVGVDLSEKMLEKARDRKLYQRLVRDDLVTMMRAEQPASFDLVLAADVLVYLGRLDEIADGAARVLRPRGLFAFSLESLDAILEEGSNGCPPDSYRLMATGRYAHSKEYLVELARAAGFEILQMRDVPGRIEGQRPRVHCACLFRRT